MGSKGAAATITTAEETTAVTAATNIYVPLGGAAPHTFRLEEVVCSHGLFMMSPNHWDPLSLTFSRPLRLPESDSVFVSISHPPGSDSLLVRVHDEASLSSEQKQAITAQVVRMLRLSEADEKTAREFREMMGGGGGVNGDGCGGRVFRSPTLFEDMVKCILLCNCQWSRTLSMATALCELQLDDVDAKGSFIPTPPLVKESARKRKRSKVSVNVTTKLEESTTHLEVAAGSTKESASLVSDGLLDDFCEKCESVRASNKVDPLVPSKRAGNFPSPGELAKLDEKFLAKKCNLGYRAGRIVKLAQGIVEGRISLRQLEETCDNGGDVSCYSELADQLRHIDGFGPFTCANVLMCMGFYHVIPADSETVRHLKQVHAKASTVQTVQKDVEEIYGKYAPFQFLAYWAEIWHFYEQRFGKISEMPCSDYKLITATNMRSKEVNIKKRRP
ncbi:hypothetical protein Tsubulata_013977 [Turnera subulata]|uniref:HhH-GPD domain-containing protein n=1 Tax=Turnera subulata TaxID=218843 RepID=A0A9Q0JAY1_9ROSI|nr:hypothetical protein Tsubulata_013977 [Turnera subulata]